MKRIYAKLIVIALQLMLAISVVAVSTYAWLVLASNPVVEGLQIAIGGGNTILVAADQAEIGADGTVYHYPGKFQDTLNLNDRYLTDNTYAYLNDLSALTPVSTADGLNWYLPAYYGLEDQEVKDGKVMVGALKAVEDFHLDGELSHANLASEQAETAAEGHYIYLDFWACSPGADYTLRLSTGEEASGSCVVTLLQAQETKDGGYTLVAPESDVSSCVRVGFLVNPDDVVDDTMLYYQQSDAYAEQYAKLRGSYTEQSTGYQAYSDQYRFYIYEPNGDAHSNTLVENGNYAITRPVGLDADGNVTQVDVSDRLTIQKRSSWAPAERVVGEGNGIDLRIEQLFQAALLSFGQSAVGQVNASAQSLTKRFYQEYLGNQFSAHVNKGQFVKNTQNLYNAAVSGMVDAEYLGEEFTAGATDDVHIITLQKNVPQRIRMFVWVEGTDVDCATGISAGSFAMQLELAGSNSDTNSNGAAAATGDDSGAAGHNATND